jgi:hypothetical protein
MNRKANPETEITDAVDMAPGSENIVAVSDFAQRYNRQEPEVIELVEQGLFEGRMQAGEWFINESELDSERGDNIWGVLIIPAVLLLFTSIVSFKALIYFFISYSKFSSAGYGAGSYILFVILSAVAAGLIFHTTILFFRKDYRAPDATVKLLYWLLAFGFLKLILAIGYGEYIAVIGIMSIIIVSIIGAIWVPYVKRSERVKTTFVRRTISLSQVFKRIGEFDFKKAHAGMRMSIGLNGNLQHDALVILAIIVCAVFALSIF